MTAEVLDVVEDKRGRTNVVIQLRSGEFAVGMKLKSGASRWRITSFGFIPARAFAKGVRAIVLKPEGPVNPLNPGDVLKSA